MIDPELLAATPLFSHLAPADIETLASQSGIRRLERNDILFHEDDEADALFIVQSGRLGIVNRSFDGRESMVALMEAGDLFGEMPLFDHKGRSAQARALDHCEVAQIPYDPIESMLKGDPNLLWQIVELLAARLRNMDIALADSVFLDVTGRVAKRLLEIAGREDDFTMPLTQEELAGMVGASRERVNKAIGQFVKLGWLAHGDDTYSILDREQLEIRSR